MGKRLYVGNLPYTVSEQDLIDKFAAIGTVESATLITDRDSGRSKGFGFVEMASDAEAQKAIEEVNGTDYDGRPVTVNEAKPMNKRDSGSRW